MKFELYRRPWKARGEPKVSIFPNGSFWLNGGALKFFQGYERTQLLFDPDTRTLALRPTKELENSFAVSRSKGRNEGTISGQGFLNYWKLISKKSKTYVVRWDKDHEAVIISLDRPL